MAAFDAWQFFGGLLFGTIGFVAFIYGKKNAEFKPMVIGAVLMGFPYLIQNVIFIYLIGVALTVFLFVWRD